MPDYMNPYGGPMMPPPDPRQFGPDPYFEPMMHPGPYPPYEPMGGVPPYGGFEPWPRPMEPEFERMHRVAGPEMYGMPDPYGMPAYQPSHPPMDAYPAALEPQDPYFAPDVGMPADAIASQDDGMVSSAPYLGAPNAVDISYDGQPVESAFVSEPTIDPLPASADATVAPVNAIDAIANDADEGRSSLGSASVDAQGQPQQADPDALTAQTAAQALDNSTVQLTPALEQQLSPAAQKPQATSQQIGQQVGTAQQQGLMAQQQATPQIAAQPGPQIPIQPGQQIAGAQGSFQAPSIGTQATIQPLQQAAATSQALQPQQAIGTAVGAAGIANGAIGMPANSNGIVGAPVPGIGAAAGTTQAIHPAQVQGQLGVGQTLPGQAQQQALGATGAQAGQTATSSGADQEQAGAKGKKGKRSKKSRKSKGQPAPQNGNPPKKGGNKLALFLGILSIIFALLPPIGLVLAIVSLSLSRRFIANGGRKSGADAARVFASVGMWFSIIVIAAIVLFVGYVLGANEMTFMSFDPIQYFNSSFLGNFFTIPIGS